MPNPPAERHAASRASQFTASRVIASDWGEAVDAPLPRGIALRNEAE
jgi:hypothetical protein